MMIWLVTDKGDQDARRIADRHYSRQTPGAPQFCRNGQNFVLVTRALDALWVTHRPASGKATRTDGLDAWECTLFRREGGAHRASDMIREAVLATVAFWGPIPPDGFLTYVDPEQVGTQVPGWCFRRAGWKHRGESRDGKPRLFAPRPKSVPPRAAWSWRRERGGKLRRDVFGEAQLGLFVTEL